MCLSVCGCVQRCVCVCESMWICTIPIFTVTVYSCALRTETEAVGPCGDQPFTLADEQTEGWGRAFAQGCDGVWNPGLGYEVAQHSRRQETRKGVKQRGRWEETEVPAPVFWAIMLRPRPFLSLVRCGRASTIPPASASSRLTAALTAPHCGDAAIPGSKLYPRSLSCAPHSEGTQYSTKESVLPAPSGVINQRQDRNHQRIRTMDCHLLDNPRPTGVAEHQFQKKTHGPLRLKRERKIYHTLDHPGGPLILKTIALGRIGVECITKI